jgi:hypothetical protein
MRGREEREGRQVTLGEKNYENKRGKKERTYHD